MMFLYQILIFCSNSRRPTGILRSHMAPIFYVHISEEDKIFSMSTDNTIKVSLYFTRTSLYAYHSFRFPYSMSQFSLCRYGILKTSLAYLQLVQKTMELKEKLVLATTCPVLEHFVLPQIHWLPSI